MPPLSSDVQNLEIQAVVFASMTGVAGAYFVLFVLALYSTFRKSGRSLKNLRVVTILLFTSVMTHFICRSLDFNQARIIPQPLDEIWTWITPLRVIESISTTLAGFLSDGLLAYRFWVIFGRTRWALYVPTTAVIGTALLGLAQSLANLAVYKHRNSFDFFNTIGVKVMKITAVWGWSMFFVNSALTTLILAKIIHVTRTCTPPMSGRVPYQLIIEAVIESALVTWIGLLLYEISSLAPEGHYTTHLDIGYVAVCILPFFFGISQCLITARLGFVNNEGMQNMSLTAPAFASSYIPSPGVPATPYLGLHLHPSGSGSSELDTEKDSTPLPAVSVV